MTALTLAETFEAVYREEFSEFDKRHFFSLRHRRKMRQILYPRNLPTSTTRRGIPIKKRVLIVMLVILLSMIGIAAGAVMSRNFAFSEQGGRSELFAVYDNNAPKTIDAVYHLPIIPDGYYTGNSKSEPSFIFTEYYNSADKFFFFYQGVKDGFSVEYYNDSGFSMSYLEEMQIGGKAAYYLCDNINYGALVWDNGDYILEIGGCLTKDELIALAEGVEPKSE